MATVSTLTVVLRTQTSVFNRGMGRSRKQLSFVQKQAIATRKALSGMFAGVIGAAGVAGITMLGKKFVEAASFAQESGNRFKEVFKLQSRAAQDFANKLASSVGRSKTNLKDMMATLQDTFVPLGIARKKGAELSGQLVKLAIDVASFKDVADETVLENFTSALVGQSKAVLKYGIVTNIGALKQELLRQGITKTFEALTTQEKVMLRFNVIMRSTIDAQGDAIRTASNHANMVKRMKSAYEEWRINLGKKMMPTMTKLVGVTIKAIAATEKINFVAIGSVARNVAVAASVLGLAKAYQMMTVAMNSAIAKRFLWSGGMKLLIADTKRWTKALIANISFMGLSALAIGALTVKIGLMHQQQIKAIKSSIETSKKQREVRKRVLEELAARPAAERKARFEKGSARGQFHGALQKAEQQRLAPLIEAGKKLTEETRSPMERFEKRIDKINDLLKEGVISWKTYGRAVRAARETFESTFKKTEKPADPFAGLGRATSDFGVLPSPDVSIKGLSIGGGSGINKLVSQGQTQINLLTVIAGKEGLM